jgi:hypothetical protein
VLLGQDGADGQGGEYLNFCAPANRMESPCPTMTRSSRAVAVPVP